MFGSTEKRSSTHNPWGEWAKEPAFWQAQALESDLPRCKVGRHAHTSSAFEGSFRRPNVCSCEKSGSGRETISSFPEKALEAPVRAAVATGNLPESYRSDFVETKNGYPQAYLDRHDHCAAFGKVTMFVP